MVDTPNLADRSEVFDGLTAVADLVNIGDGGLVALQRTVELAPLATGADGAAFIEYARDGGRIIAVSGDLEWSLGHPVDPRNPALRALLHGMRVREIASSMIGTEGAQRLVGQGLRRVMLAEATAGADASSPPGAGGTLVGLLIVGYRDEGGAATAEQRSALAFMASLIATQYALGRGLPVYQDGPMLAPSGDAFALLGPDSVVRSWNPAAALLTAVSAESAVGRPWPFPLPVSDEVIEHQMACGRWIQIRSAPVPHSSDLAVSFRPRPEPSSDGRDLFIALTGHELRTPVTVIRGYADTLVEHWESLDEETRRRAVFVVGQRARELARLVDRLLNAVSDDGRPVGSSVALPFDLVDMLGAAVNELSPELRRDLRVSLPSTLPKAHGDRSSITTVLRELVTNACKYSRNWVQAELSAGADAQTVWFRVADRGIGIRPEHVERAFERFWQMETGDQRSSGGVGLGLYLVRRIVERQHGWVSLRPRPGGGTVAEVRLPRADADSHETDSHGTDSHGEA